jgi:hypothetical protein
MQPPLVLWIDMSMVCAVCGLGAVVINVLELQLFTLGRQRVQATAVDLDNVRLLSQDSSTFH